MKLYLNLIIFFAILLVGYLLYAHFSVKKSPSVDIAEPEQETPVVSQDIPEEQPTNLETQEQSPTEKSSIEPVPQDFLVYLTVAIEDQFKDPNLGKIIIRLYNNTPKTSHNFMTLCEQKKYSNVKIHRVIKNFMIQTGDFTNQDGTGGYSIYGQKFEDENFLNKHDKPGLLSMANSGPNTNGSQFFITTAEASHLDGKHVVFGEVISGMEYVYDIENQVTNHNDEPVRKCYISDSGLFNPQEHTQQQPSIPTAY